MDVFLHVGAHRTATTTLQRMLGQSGAALAAAGIAYWGPRRTRGGLFRGLLGDHDAALPWDISRAQNRIRMKAAVAADEGATSLVISEENMLGTLRGVLEGTRLYPGAGARVARVADGLAGRPITVGLGIRCYDAWWTSVLAFRLTRGGVLPTRGLCDRLVTQPRRWRHVIADLAQAMPGLRIVVWSHERMGPRPDHLMARVLERAVGFDMSGGPRNMAVAPEILRAYLEECGLDPGLVRTQAGRFMPFDAHQRTTLRAQYAEDLAWLSAGAGGLADYLDEPGQEIPGLTGHGRKGRPDDERPRYPENRRLA